MRASPAASEGSTSGTTHGASSAKPPTSKIASTTQLASTDAPAGGNATAALVRAHTDKIRSKNTKELPKNAPVATGPDLSRSAVFTEDPKDTAGTGLVPWLILGLAVIILVSYGIWRGMGG